MTDAGWDVVEGVPIVAADGRSLARAVRVAGKVEPLFVETPVELPEAICDLAQDGDVVIVMGAGSIGQVAARARERAGELARERAA